MDHNNQHYIYVLVDPNTDDIRYVGASKNPNNRISSHLNNSDPGAKKNFWIDSLKRNNQKPLIRILEKCKREEAKEREWYWISYFQKMGFDITNSVYPGCDKKEVNNQNGNNAR